LLEVGARPGGEKTRKGGKRKVDFSSFCFSKKGGGVHNGREVRASQDKQKGTTHANARNATGKKGYVDDEKNEAGGKRKGLPNSDQAGHSSWRRGERASVRKANGGRLRFQDVGEMW